MNKMGDTSFNEADGQLNKAQKKAVDITEGPVLVVAGAGTGKTRVIVERISRLIAGGAKPESILALTFTEKAAGEMLDRVNAGKSGVTLDTTIATFNRFGNDLLSAYGSEYGLGTLRLLGDTGQLVFLREHLDEFELDYFAPVSNPEGQLDMLAGYVSLLKTQLVHPKSYQEYAQKLPSSDEAEQLDKQKHLELAKFYDAYLRLCRQNQVIDYDDHIYLTIEMLGARPNILRELQARYNYILVDEFQDTNPMQSKLVDLLAQPSDTKAGQAGADNQTITLPGAEAVSVREPESQASRIDNTVPRESEAPKPKMSGRSAGSDAPHQSRETGAGNVMVVGDDDQSIYGWRGATLANILDFKTRYPAAEQVALIENYRSTQSILDSAYRLIQYNNPHRLEIMNQLDKRLIANNGEGPAPVLKHFTSYDAELAWLAQDILKRLELGESPSSIAVLARRNQGVQKIHETLELYGIVHAVAGLGNDIYAQNTVQQLIEALKCVADPLDDLALFHSLSGPLFALDIGELSQLAAAGRNQHASLAETIRLSDNDKAQAALKTIDAWRAQASELSVGSVAYNLMTDSGWKQKLYIEAEHDSGVFTEVQALSKYFKTLKEFERVAGVASVQNYVINLPALKAAGSGFEDATLDISDSLVNVLSVHRAKGLEWDTVYIVDCTEGSFPLSTFGKGLSVPDELQVNPSQADEHMPEERRLMYVAVTRARQQVILSYSDHHGSGALRKPSRFLGELLGDQPNETLELDAPDSNLELFAPHTASAAVQLPISMLQDDRFVLSVSQIECWLRCPQDFYYKYVLSMPLPPAPQLGYGTLVHRVIEQIHRGRRDGGDSNVPKLQDLIDQTLAALPRAGYASARSRERARAQAAKTIQKVYERFTKSDLPLEAELPFAVTLPDLSLTMRGRIDAVYKLGQGVEIRDYKTGTSVDTAAKAKQRATGSGQLTLYALAWQLLHDEMPALLSLDFVETGQIGSVKKQPKSLQTVSIKLSAMVKDLQAGNYPAGKDHRRCSHPV